MTAPGEDDEDDEDDEEEEQEGRPAATANGNAVRMTLIANHFTA